MGANASSSALSSPQRSTSAPTTAALTLSADSQLRGGFLPEILELVAEGLVGFDVLQLSHTCPAFRSALSTPSVWAYRIGGSIDTPAPAPHGGAWCAEQEAYFRARSLRFRGLESIPRQPKHRHTIFDKVIRHKPAGKPDCGDACELPFMLLPEENGRLSFDLWFSLLDITGGILFGVQSQSCFTPGRTPHHIDRFVHVDPERNLYCSVLVGKPVVASELELERWYHLALVFDGVRQSVYLDGELVSSGRGLAKPQDKWHWTRHAQLGTGFIAESSRGKPSSSFSGWYPFHGLIDECRVWYDALSDGQIELLARNDTKATPPPVFQLSADRSQRREGAQGVRCSRPVERLANVHIPRVACSEDVNRRSSSSQTQG